MWLLTPLLCGGVEDLDYSQYPGVELQRDWLTAYLESYKHSSGLEARVTDAEVTRLYLQVCKFSLVGVLLLAVGSWWRWLQDEKPTLAPLLWFLQASNFFWGLWAIFQSRHSSIHFDFQRLVRQTKHLTGGSGGAVLEGQT